MSGKNTAVYGLYSDRRAVEFAIEKMKGAGFRNAYISVLFQDNSGTKDFAHEKNTKAPEGMTTGATSGAVIGGTLGWLAGVGLLAVPGVGPLIAAGPVMAALAGVGAVGAAGGLVGALIGAGIPEYEAKRFEGFVRDGRILVSVHCDDSDWVSRAKDLLEATGAKDVASANEAKADIKTDKPLDRIASLR